MNEPADSRVVEFAIAGMTCAACSARLEKVLNRQPGIEANVNLAAERARVRAAMRELLLHLARTLPTQDRRSRPGGRGVRRPDTEL